MLTLFAATAIAAAGIVADPCVSEPKVPPDIAAWREQVYTPGNKTMPAPPPSTAAYRAAYMDARRTDWADLCRYRKENAAIAGRTGRRPRVVFMGDSITEGWRFADGDFGDRGWLGRGISGQTTPQMLLRFNDDVVALHPQVVHIMGGTNDVAGNTGPTTIDTVVGNVSAMITLAKAAGIRVVLAAVPPAGAFPWRPDVTPSPIIAALNARLKALAVRQRVVFVDYGAVLARPDGAMQPRLALDGVHPNWSGYAAMHPLAVAALTRAAR